MWEHTTMENYIITRQYHSEYFYPNTDMQNMDIFLQEC